MHRPVLVTAPATLPVSLAEAKLHLRVDHFDEDTLIEGLIRAATEHLDGWTGILGCCLVEQTWRQDYDRFARSLCLRLGPVISVTSVTWRNAVGQVSTVASSDYDLRTDAGGRSLVRFDDHYSFPGDLHGNRAVAVTYSTGYQTLPEPLKVAILLLAGHWYQNREAATAEAVNELPFAVNALIATYRRVGV